MASCERIDPPTLKALFRGLPAEPLISPCYDFRAVASSAFRETRLLSGGKIEIPKFAGQQSPLLSDNSGERSEKAGISRKKHSEKESSSQMKKVSDGRQSNNPRNIAFYNQMNEYSKRLSKILGPKLPPQLVSRQFRSIYKGITEKGVTYEIYDGR